MKDVAKPLPLERATELAHSRIDACRERRRRHHVDRARESTLPEHLPAREDQQREGHARIVDEALQWRLDPGLGDADHSASRSSALSISIRISPMLARASAMM